MFALVSAALAGPIQADLHLDTPTQLVRQKVSLEARSLEGGLPAMTAGGTNVAVMALWPPRDTKWEEHVETLLATSEREDARLDAVELARTPSEARRIAAEGRIAIAYSLEGAHGLAKSGVEGLRRLQARGLMMLGQTWSFSNDYAGSSGDGGGGLTEKGRALVDEARRLGVLVDVSHASQATTMDVCRGSTWPVVASHSDAAAVRANARNLSDEEIACIAATGGVIGLNLHGPFLGAAPSVAVAADHLEHLRDVGGLGVVALGSDFDGIIQPPPDLKTSAELGALWAELRRRGWTEPMLDAVRGENFLRAWAVARSLAGLEG